MDKELEKAITKLCNRLYEQCASLVCTSPVNLDKFIDIDSAVWYVRNELAKRIMELKSNAKE